MVPLTMTPTPSISPMNESEMVTLTTMESLSAESKSGLCNRDHSSIEIWVLVALINTLLNVNSCNKGGFVRVCVGGGEGGRKWN